MNNKTPHNRSWVVRWWPAALILVLLTGAYLIIRVSPLSAPGSPVETSTAQLPSPVPTAAPSITPTKHLRPTSTVTVNPTPTVPSAVQTVTLTPLATSEWHQDAHDGQRSGYTPEEPLEPWTLLWTWNGPDENGGAGGHFYDAPPEARTITGGGLVFVPAGEAGLFALEANDGLLAWHIDLTSFNAAPAYHPDLQRLYAGGTNGLLYEIEPQTGLVRRTYQAGSPINKAILLAGESAYIITEAGALHQVLLDTLEAGWVYQAGAPAATPPAYSLAQGVIVFASEDLFVHAVEASGGTRLWRVKPTIHDAQPPYTFSGYWPVIAEMHGLVFVRLNLGMDGLWSGPGEGNMYPTSNAETRQYLEENPHLKNLFALRLADGQEAFTPAVGFGGVETLVDEEAELSVGPVPVVRILANGSEVAYLPFRSGQGAPPDGRWDTHLGEMVLDSETLPDLGPGDLRFIQFDHGYAHITDEQCPLTLAGNTLFHAHWGASESARIIDRSEHLGLSAALPITTQPLPTVLRRIQACSSFDPRTHWTNCDLILFDDGREWKGPGFWTYWNVLDPPTPHRNAYSEGLLPRYTYVSAGLVVIQGNGGELLVFRHSGLPLSKTYTNLSIRLAVLFLLQ